MASADPAAAVNGVAADVQPANGVATTSAAATGVLCGPLLNYKRLTDQTATSATWHGTILVVTTPTENFTSLSLGSAGGAGESRTFQPTKLYQDSKAAFWRFQIDLPLQHTQSQWQYNIPGLKYVDDAKNTAGADTKVFNVPAVGENMRIMFHSCNGFSVGTDEEAWSGCALWNDVLRQHKERPIHVMIGGGDQIYNDSIRVSGPLRPWTDITNPRKRREYPFPEDLRSKCDEFYFKNYTKWYSTAPFSDANAIIPQINIWDDHDIIDGFGSYTDHFMRCAVFRGIGGVAHKYYMLFQHHLAPPKSTYTTDSKQTTTAADTREDPVQLKDTYVLTEKDVDPMYIAGSKPGPYVEQHSMSIFTQLGANIAFMGIDARTERTRHQINYPETYDKLFKHVDQQIKASNGQIKHFILLLGVPIAYPRLQWLENFLQSPLIAPVRFMNKRFGFAGGLFNDFDGNVDLLDDLDDHYTAHQHKTERKKLILHLQQIAKANSVRITILGGDVHLAAFGRFYSNPKHALAPENDFRYMPNIVSSAITNHPPPAAVANLLSRRNKIHHLDHDTDETLLNLFDKDPGENDGKSPGKKTANVNHCTMPSRNYALINMAHTAGSANGAAAGTSAPAAQKGGNPRDPLGEGEVKCGTGHPAASGLSATGLGDQWNLDVSYRVEVDHSNKEGITDGYGLCIPSLQVKA